MESFSGPVAGKMLRFERSIRLRGITEFMIQRIRIVIRGAVQGIGFRPFIYRLATEMSCPAGSSTPRPASSSKWKEAGRNWFSSCSGPAGEAERSFIQRPGGVFSRPCGYSHFEIRESDAAGEKTAVILPTSRRAPTAWTRIFNPEDSGTGTRSPRAPTRARASRWLNLFPTIARTRP